MTKMAEKGYAFLVGIDEYKDDKLRTFDGDDSPSRNVEDIIEWLELNVSHYKIQYKLTDQPITNETLNKNLKDFLTQLAYKDVLIYFSGHGYQTLDPDTNTKKGYLGTYDSRLIFDDYEKESLTNQQHGFAFETLSRLINDAKHLNSLVLWIDACYSGFAIQNEVLRSALSGLSPSFKYSILVSSLSSEESYSGIFTKPLVERLKNKALGPITADIITNYVREKLSSSPQLPVDISSGAGSILLMNYPSTGLEIVKEPIKCDAEIVCPYRGLQYFDDDEVHQKFFFGREADILKIRTKLDNSSFVLVIGASGSGKSSVVRAGLLQKELRQNEEDKWHILKIIKPGDKPLKRLKEAFDDLKDKLTEKHSAYQLIDQFTDEDLPTVEILETILEQLRGNKTYLLVIDQFEEIFTLTVSANQSQCEQDEYHEKKDPRIEKQDRFIELVTKVAEVENSPLKVVVTMRADFLGSCLNYPTLKNLIDKDINVFYIAPLLPSGLISAIKEPAARQGYPIEPDLQDALIEDVDNQPGYLPLLEFTLEQLWKKRVDEPQPCIPLAAYRKLGSESTTEDNNKKISGLKLALNLHANKVYKYSSSYELSEQELEQQPKLQRCEEEQKWIRLIFLKLVHTGQGNTDTRQRQPHSSLLEIVEQRDKEKVNQVIDSLIKGRLLVSDQSDPTTQDKVIDLAHEALIDGWQQFATWRQEDREIRRAAERLEDARQDWEKAQEKDKTQYLISRALLAQVRENWGSLKFYLKDRKRTGEFYRLSSKYEQTEKLELQLQVDANRVEQWISARKPPLEILTLAIQTIGKNREQIPQKLVGSVPASLRQVVEKIFIASHPYGHTEAVNSVTFSPDGQTIVSGSWDFSVRLWNLNGTPKGNPLQGHTEAVNSVAFSPDGQTIVSGSGDKSVQLWNINGTPKGNPLEGHTSSVTSVAFSPDGQTIVSGSGDKSVQLWNINGTPKGNPLEGHTSSVTSVAFSPDGQTIVSGSGDKSVQLWNINGTPKGNPLEGHTSSVTSVAFSPDGQTIVSGSGDKSVQLWNINGTPKGNPLEGHTSSVTSVAFSPDGQTIVSGSGDKSVQLWNINGTPKGNPLEGHTSSVNSVAFSPDGQTIVSGSSDNS
ncbi:MAG: WD40 repeat domain-containing protein, partial [Rhizonema sp. PD37]|nr:WD40 repeat domain-containing protein [Rhizonema sp. PD37]